MKTFWFLERRPFLRVNLSTWFTIRKWGQESLYLKREAGTEVKYYGKQKPTYYSSNGTRYPRDVITFRHDKEKLHATQKPVALCEYLIHTYTNEGDLVLDNCAGSGSILIAAHNTNRKFIGFEKDEEIYNIAVERLGKHGVSNGR